MLRRTADDDDPYERPIVANADQLVIVTALADPPPRIGMIDRILVAGFDAGIEPLLCLTKADLASPDELVAQYEPLGVPVAVTSPGADLTVLRAPLAGPPQRLRRPLRRRQVDPGQRADPRGACGPSARSTRSPAAVGTPRPRPSRCGCRTSRVMGDRHPGRAVLRAQPRQPGPHPSAPSPTSRRSPRTARAAAATRPTRPECALDAAVDRGELARAAAGVVSPDARLGPVG